MVWSPELSGIIKEEREGSHFKKNVVLGNDTLEKLLIAYYTGEGLSLKDVKFKDLEKVAEKTIELSKSFGEELDRAQISKYWNEALREIALEAIKCCYDKNSIVIYEVIDAEAKKYGCFVRIISNPFNGLLHTCLDSSDEYTIKEINSQKLKEKGYGIIDLGEKPYAWHNAWKTFNSLDEKFK